MEFSFDSIKAEVENKLSSLSQWKKTIYFSVYERLIDVMSYILNKTAYLAEFLYRESNWRTAQKRESLMYKADFLSYTPYRKVAPYGVLDISEDPLFDVSYIYTGESIIIPRWTVCRNAGGDLSTFTTSENIYYKNTVGNLEADVKQGTPKEYIYTAAGTISEAITIFSDSVENEELEVFIVDANNAVLANVYIVGTDDNPEELYFVDDLVTYYCDVANSDDFQSVIFTFGDGISSRQLVAGERVLIKYAETLGAEGNIQNTDVITVIADDLVDALGNEASLYVTNPDEISDGSDAEDIESIRSNGRNLFSTGYRAGSDPDWVAVLEAHPYIHKAIVWTNYDISGILLDEEQSKIYVTAISADGSDLTSAQEADITVNYLKSKKSPTDVVIWEVSKRIYAAFKVVAKIDNLPFDIVTAQIQEELTDNYGVLNVDFKTNINFSNFYNVIDDLDEVIYHESEIYNMEHNFSAATTGHTLLVSNLAAVESDAEKQIYLFEDSLEIWIKRKIAGVWSDPLLIGHDDTGSILGDNGYTIINDAISYATNVISFTVEDIINDPVAFGVQDPGDSDPLGYILNVLYKTQDGSGGQTNSVRLPKFDFITDIDEDYVFTSLSYQ